MDSLVRALENARRARMKDRAATGSLSEAEVRGILDYLEFPKGSVPAQGCIGRVAALLSRARAQGNQVICIDAVAEALGVSL